MRSSMGAILGGLFIYIRVIKDVVVYEGAHVANYTSVRLRVIRYPVKWRPADQEKAFYDLGQMDRREMYREHRVRVIGELGRISRDVDRGVRGSRSDLDVLYSEWGLRER